MALVNSSTAPPPDRQVDATAFFCTEGRYWYLFLLSSVAVLAVGIISSLLIRLLAWITHKCYQTQCCYPRKKRRLRAAAAAAAKKEEDAPDFFSQLKEFIGFNLSGQRRSGRIILIFLFTLNIGSFILYLLDANKVRYEKGRRSLEICLPFMENTVQKIDLTLNICFLMHFIARLIITDNYLLFWFELFSIVDILTIPPAFLALFLGRSWLGLRFSRCLTVLALKDVLQYVNILRSSTAIRLCQLVTFFAGLVLSASGFVHLLENSGDPPHFENPQDLSYFDCLYLCIVTVATVGYGDFTCRTIIGRAFMIAFILVALAVFANAIPEIADIVNSRTKYGGTYVRRLGKPHLVLCGHITFSTVKNFLSDFLHKDREDVVTQIVILDQQEPNLELQGLLKRYENQVHFFQGSVMLARDLTRVGLEIADACLVLANKYSNDPDAEDATNIMRVISIKNNCAHIKVIVQLMQYHNKTYLLNIPSWDWRRGDDAICVAELKLGFLAQNSLAPGFSTLLANLFTMRTYRRTENLQPNWLNDYMEGAGMEMYTEVFSPAFEGMTFGAAAELCFIRLRLLLIAVSCKDEKDNNLITINPGNNIKVTATTQGFFIAQSAEEAKRASFYCPRCHGNISDMRKIKQCACTKVHRAVERSRTSSTAIEAPLFHNAFLSPIGVEVRLKNRRPVSSVNAVSVHTSWHNARRGAADNHVKLDKTWGFRLPGINPYHGIMRGNLENLPLDMLATVKVALNEQQACRFDCTGMFHWCPEQPLQDCLLDVEQPNSGPNFADHIVVCLFADHRSPLIGLRSFIMPLRASNLHSNEVKTVVLLGNLDYIKREWKALSNFPNIWVLPGSPLCRANLRAVKINFASMCVILSSKSDSTKEDLTLVDKEAILCSLNVKAMDFSDAYCSEESNQCRQPPLEVRWADTTPGPHTTSGGGSAGGNGSTVSSGLTSQARPVDFASLQRNRSIIPNLFQKSGSVSVGPAETESQVIFNRPPRFVSSTGHTIPMATELSFDMNVQFLDQEDEDDESGELFMTQPFACGTAFTISVLDSLMSTAYFNESALTLIRSLVTGGSTPFLEKMLSDGMGMRGGNSSLNSLGCRDRCRVAQLALTGSAFSRFTTEGSVYEQLFLHTLRNYGILIIGIYRLLCGHKLKDRDPNKYASNEHYRRFVITNPPPQLPIYPTDWIFCLVPFKHTLEPSALKRI